jgi:DNA-binding response OmpR family regulator
VLEPHSLSAELQARSVSLRRGEQTDRQRSGPRVILLFTRDRALDQLLAEALLGSSAIVLIARSVADALQIVCGRGRELDLAVLDVDHGCRAMTLLSAVHTCYDRLPVLVAAVGDADQLSTLAHANGARAFLNKPLDLARLRETMAAMMSRRGDEDVGPRGEQSRAPSPGNPAFRPPVSHAHGNVH